MSIGYYEIKKASNGAFRFNLKAANHEVILTSEAYKTRASAETGIASVQKNCTEDGQYERKQSTTGKEFFLLKAKNHQAIGVSQMYSTHSSMEDGIDSVKQNGVSQTVKELMEA